MSQHFRDFLCKATKSHGRANIAELLAHPWITSEEVIGADSTIKDIISLSFIGCKEFTVNVEKQTNNLIENLKVVLTGREDAKPSNSEAIKEFSLEIGMNTDTLYKKILEIF